jgi:hypothetical protein
MQREPINDMLRKSIGLLAAMPDIQRQYLRKSGSFPSTDELALEFDDAYQQFMGQPGFSRTNIITSKLIKINWLLDSFSETEDTFIWLEESLDHQSWGEIRDIARSILKEIGD